MPDFNISVREQNGVVIIDTDGYLNNVGGEIIASECYSQVDKGKKDFILNLEKSPVVNSIGVSIIIEIIEKLQDVNGSLSYFNLAPIVDKTFSIMGLTKYSTIYTNEEEALKNLEDQRMEWCCKLIDKLDDILSNLFFNLFLIIS